MPKRLHIIFWMIVISLVSPAYASPYDVIFGQVQQLIGQATKNDDAGLATIQQQLESVPKHAHQNVKEARAFNQQGLEALKQHNYSAAAVFFQKAQEADPADIEIAGNLGYANLKLKLFRRAEHQLVYAISLSPTRSSSWFNLGQAYGAMGETEKAAGSFANAYRFSQNRAKTEGFFRDALVDPENNEATRSALKQALALFSL